MAKKKLESSVEKSLKSLKIFELCSKFCIISLKSSKSPKSPLKFTKIAKKSPVAKPKFCRQQDLKIANLAINRHFWSHCFGRFNFQAWFTFRLYKNNFKGTNVIKFCYIKNLTTPKSAGYFLALGARSKVEVVLQGGQISSTLSSKTSPPLKAFFTHVFTPSVKKAVPMCGRQWQGSGSFITFFSTKEIYWSAELTSARPVWPEDFFSNCQSEVSKSPKNRQRFLKISWNRQNFEPKSPSKTQFFQFYCIFIINFFAGA